MSRSLRKGPYVDPKLLKKVAKFKPDGKTVIKTWSRDSEIAPEMVGYTFAVHNGKDFVQITISDEMIGHRFGEFSPTKKFIRHGGKMQKELEAAQKTASTESSAPAVK